MGAIASQITSLTVVYSTVYSDADQRKHQSSASLAFVWGIHRDRWIPRTKGQLRGKCFHLMTSSCSYVPRTSKETKCVFILPEASWLIKTVWPGTLRSQGHSVMFLHAFALTIGGQLTNISMATSWHGSAFRFTCPLWGESTGHRWIPLIKRPVMWTVNDSLLLAWKSCWTNTRDVGDLRRPVAQVTVMPYRKHHI